jgi:Fur family ferric uptake transcriptional regulator
MNAVHLLKHYNLRLTDCRKEVVSIFLAQRQAIGQPALEQQLFHFDRVTLYRTLSTFLEKGIIHKVFDDSGMTKYALCPEHCHQHHEHQDEHIHFKCVKCNTTTCIASITIPIIELPKGYTFIDANLLVRGGVAINVNKLNRVLNS